MHNYLIIFICLLIVLSFQKREQNLNTVLKHIRSKKGDVDMTELIQNYLGKECLIYTCTSSSQIEGTIISCRDGWIEIEKNGQKDIVNCEYITRIREYPRNKNGKKKGVVLD